MNIDYDKLYDTLMKTVRRHRRHANRHNYVKMEDPGPPIESKNIHADSDRPYYSQTWTGEFLDGLEPVPDPNNNGVGMVLGKHGVPVQGGPAVLIGMLQPGEEILKRASAPARYREGRIVWVASKTYGSFLGRVDEPVKIGSRWFYEVSDGMLQVAYDPPKHVKRLIVPEDALEAYTTPIQAPTGTSDAVAAAWMRENTGFMPTPQQEAFFDSPTRLRTYYDERLKEGVVEPFGHEAFKIAREDQKHGQDNSTDDQEQK